MKNNIVNLRCYSNWTGNYFKYIVWRKTAEPDPISVGNMIYAPDTRYKVAFGPERREFNLVIRAVTQNDAGVYECQVHQTAFLKYVLEVRHSKHEDSGEYVCRNSEILMASKKVIVLN
ncbi:hypothetical protein DPMN_114397, partial [Dreissena polymorpha]